MGFRCPRNAVQGLADTAPCQAQITALYPDGAALDVVTEAGTVQVFVPFAVQAPPHEALQSTVKEAMRRLGLKPEGRVAHWRLRSAQDLTPNLRRLMLDLQGDTREDWRPGDACRFDIPGHEHGRPYTLRSVSDTQATVDVYCHGGTLGSRWAQSLQPGHPVTVRGGRHEPLPDFGAGAHSCWAMKRRCPPSPPCWKAGGGTLPFSCCWKWLMPLTGPIWTVWLVPHRRRSPG